MRYIISTSNRAMITFARYDACHRGTTAKVDDSPFTSFIENPRIVTVGDIPGNTAGLSSLLRSYGVPTIAENAPHGALTSPGGFISESVLARPVELHQRIGGSLTKRVFEELRANGVIVLQPLKAVEISVSDSLVPDGPQRLLYSYPYRLGFNTPPTSPTYPCRVGNAPGPAIYEGLTGLPFSRGAVLSGSYAGQVKWGSWFNEVTYSCYEGNVVSAFSQYGKPDLQGLVDHLDGLNHPPGLLNSALDEINSGVYDVLTELGELPETVRYIYDILRRLVLLFLGLKSKEAQARKRFKGKELVDEITSLWMQFRYAASPLAYSAHDALKLLAQKPLTYITARKREDVPFRYGSGVNELSGVAEHRVFVKARVDTTSLQGMGINPYKTLWELTPLSFVVDWVLPIGTLLGAMGTPPGLRQIAASHSVRVRALRSNYGPTTCDVYITKPIEARADLRIVPDVFLNWKRACDSLSLAWSLFLRQHWKS